MKALITHTLRRALLLLGGILLVSAPSAYPAGLNSAKGCVVHKGSNNGFAVLDEYVSYESFGTLINFTGAAGNKFRVYHGENPILIPYASDLGATSETAGKALARALESAPHLRQKLDVITQAWFNRNAFEKAARQKQAALIKSKAVTSTPLKTKSGAEFRDWSISRIEGTKAHIQHADGSTSVLIADILSETLWLDPVVKKAINEGTEKEAKGDLQDALAIFTQFGLKEAIGRVTEKLAHEKEGNGDLKAAREFYSQINSAKNVARLTAQIDEQEQKMRAETKAKEIQQDQLDRRFGGTLLQVNPIESQAAQFANMQAMQISAAKSGYHFDIPSLTRLKEGSSGKKVGKQMRVGPETALMNWAGFLGEQLRCR